MNQTIDFIPFLCIDKNESYIKNIKLNVLDVEEMEIVKCISCNPTAKDLKYMCVDEISICRIADVVIDRKRNKTDKNYIDGEIMEQTTQTHYSLTYYFREQRGRFMIKEFAIAHRLTNELVSMETTVRIEAKIR